MSSLPFDIAAASVTGREHSRAGRNNQDAFCFGACDEGVAAVVADGCGSGSHSELGAQAGARQVVASALRLLRDGARPEDAGFLGLLQERSLSFLRDLAGALGKGCLQDCLLFTLVGAVVTPSHTLVFSAGDGVWALNGQVHPLGPFPGNAPPYLAYGLMPESLVPLLRQALVPTPQVESLLLGTDGVGDLARLADALVPEHDEPVGPLSQFWREERYFRNPDALRRRLSLLCRESLRAGAPGQRPVRTPSLLPDDTTLVVLRRRPGEPGRA
ncbi:protein phosphatase 2C domain-containing protein [Myxococcaceae bacterium GXIMD 01537]